MTLKPTSRRINISPGIGVEPVSQAIFIDFDKKTTIVCHVRSNLQLPLINPCRLIVYILSIECVSDANIRI